MDNLFADKPRRGRPPKDKVQAKVGEAVVTEEAHEPVAPVVDRPAMRPPMRDDDPRTAAARRAAEIRQHRGGTMDDGIDEFAAPPPPDGWSYEWKRKSVMGQEDHGYQVKLAHDGWEPVPTSRHPHMMPEGNHPTIERKGQVLMMRPKVITDEMREVEIRRARQQVRSKEQQLTQAPDGQFERNDPRVRPQIKKGYEPMEVPKE